MTKHINLALAVDLLASVVKDFGRDHTAGDTSTTACTYVRRGEDGYTLIPVCIVGQVFARLGFLGVIESEGACYWDQGDFWNVLAPFVTVDEDARRFFYDAQMVQDNNIGTDTGTPDTTWGRALDYALTNAEERRKTELLGDDMVLRRIEVIRSAQVEPLAPWEEDLLRGDPWDAHVGQGEPPF